MLISVHKPTRVRFYIRLVRLNQNNIILQYPRFIQKDKTRIWYRKRFSSHSKPYPRFIQKDKTRMGYIKRFSSHSKSYPRFIHAKG